MTTLARPHAIAALANRQVREVRTDTATRDSSHMLSDESGDLCFVLRFASGEELDVELTGSGREPSSVWRVFHLLRQLSELPHGWDSYGGLPLSAIAVKRSVNLFPLLLPPESPIPSVVPTRDGGVQFEWHRHGVDIEVKVPPAGPMSYYIADARTNEEFEGEGAPEKQRLRAALNRLGEAE